MVDVGVLEQAVAPLRRWLEILRNQNGDNERIDGDNSRHDHGDEALEQSSAPSFRGSLMTSSIHFCVAHLHNQIWPKRPHARDANARLGGAVCRPHA